MSATIQSLINRVEKIEERTNPSKRVFIKLGDVPLPPEAVGSDVLILHVIFVRHPPYCIKQEDYRKEGISWPVS